MKGRCRTSPAEMLEVLHSPPDIHLALQKIRFLSLFKRNYFLGLKVDVRSIRLYVFQAILFVSFCSQACFREIFILLDIYMVLHRIHRSENIWLCQEKSFCTFLSARTYTPTSNTLLVRILRTKSYFRTLTEKHHTNIKADENFRTKMHESTKRTKQDQNRVKRTATLKHIFSRH